MQNLTFIDSKLFLDVFAKFKGVRFADKTKHFDEILNSDRKKRFVSNIHPGALH